MVMVLEKLHLCEFTSQRYAVRLSLLTPQIQPKIRKVNEFLIVTSSFTLVKSRCRATLTYLYKYLIMHVNIVMAIMLKHSNWSHISGKVNS